MVRVKNEDRFFGVEAIEGQDAERLSNAEKGRVVWRELDIEDRLRGEGLKEFSIRPSSISAGGLIFVASPPGAFPVQSERRRLGKDAQIADPVA